METKRLAFFVLLLIPLVGAGQELPNATDLKAMYCLDFTESTMASLESATKTNVERAAIEKLRQNSARLRAYLVPRLFSLDELPLLVAKNRAIGDLQSATAELNSCLKSCVGKPGEESSAICRDGCVSQPREATQRLRSCSDLSWLPF